MSITVSNSEGRKITYGYDDIRYNPIGLFVTRDGKLYQAPYGPSKIDIDKVIYPSVSSNGYLYITEKDVEKLNISLKCDVEDINGEIVLSCEFVHRIVVFSFGDKDGRDFNVSKRTMRCEIDHINMNKSDPSVSNLQLVSKGINLFRAYYKTASVPASGTFCKNRFATYYNSLDPIDRMILDKEISLDLEGKY